MAGVFDFALPSRVSETQYAEDDSNIVKFRGWEFAARSDQPLQRKFKVTLTGMRWYVGNGVLDVATNPTYNAGRLQQFFESNRLSGSFQFQHEYLGTLTCRFAAPVLVPRALADSNGLLDAIEISLIHANPAYTL